MTYFNICIYDDIQIMYRYSGISYGCNLCDNILNPTPSLPIPYTLHPTPDTLYPAPYTLRPTPYTLHPLPYTLHPTPYTLHPTRQSPTHRTPKP